MYIHHFTCLVMFLPRSRYGRDRKMTTTGHPSQRPFALPRISTSNIGIFKRWNINDNQWTVEWHTWLPYKINQFHIQHDFLFSSKRLVFVRAWPKLFCQRSQIVIVVEKCYPWKICFDKYKNKKCTPNPCCVASVYFKNYKNMFSIYKESEA